mgnify:FL=1
MKHQSILIVLILVLLNGTWASEIDEAYELGLKAYESGQYNLAIQEFEKIVESGWESSELHYNLGNAYYRDDNMAAAVWAFEKCLKSEPGHKDAAFNLPLVNLRVKDRVDIPEPPVYLKIYNQIKIYLHPGQWIILGAVLLLLISLFRMLRLIRNMGANGPIRKTENIIWVILILTILVGLNAITDYLTKHEGIIYKDQVTATSEPNEYSTTLFIVHEGLKIKVLDTKDDWVEIELIDGKSGWIPNSSLRII